MKFGIACSAILASTLALAGITFGAPAKHLSAAQQAVYKTGKGLYTTRHCDSCHGADLKGQPGMAPSLLPSGPLSNYTAATFRTLMTKNIGYNGQKLAVPMAGKLGLNEIDALYVYLSNQ